MQEHTSTHMQNTLASSPQLHFYLVMPGVIANETERGNRVW